MRHSFILPLSDNKETAKQVQEAGGQCWAYTVDLCDRHAVYAAANKVKQEVGKVSAGNVDDCAFVLATAESDSFLFLFFVVCV